MRKDKNIENSGKKENKIVIIIASIIILLDLVGIILFNLMLSQNEKVILDLAYEQQPQFKDPTTVRVTDATVYNNGEYVILQMGGNNSFGAFVNSTYYIKDNTFYTKEDNYKVAKEIVENCYEYEKEGNVETLNSDSISKINNKLEKRYK